MTRQTKHAVRLAMRCFYTVTGFFVAVLTADIAHDGLAATGAMLPSEAKFLVAAAVCWGIAVVLDGLTSEPDYHRRKWHDG